MKTLLRILSKALQVQIAILFIFLFISMPQGAAGQETYLYDDLGRLKSMVRETGESVDFTYDEAGNLVQEIQQGSREAVQLCADITRRKKFVKPDKDFFIFCGRAGELVTVLLKADPPEAGIGRKLALTLRACTTHRLQRVADVSVLPNEVSLILEHNGFYIIEVYVQKRMIRRGEGYTGPYCVTLEAEPKTAASFSTYRE